MNEFVSRYVNEKSKGGIKADKNAPVMKIASPEYSFVNSARLAIKT